MTPPRAVGFIYFFLGFNQKKKKTLFYFFNPLPSNSFIIVIIIITIIIRDVKGVKEKEKENEM